MANVTTVKLNAKSIGGVIQTQYSGNVTVGPDAFIVVNVLDVPALLAAGCTYVNSRTNFVTYTTAIVAATAGQFVASTSLTNGTLSIANQPDVPRMGQVRVDPGTLAITAGNIAVTYLANDGTTQVDNISPVTPANTVLTAFTSKGMISINSVIVTNLAGGGSPHVQMDSNNYIACPVDAGFQDFVELAEYRTVTKETNGTVYASAACIAPSVAPNGTATYTFGYSYTTPDI